MLRAAMDVGTNSCRLLLAAIEDGKVNPEYRDIVTTRIGKGLAATGRLDADGMRMTLDCLRRWGQLLVQRGVERYQLVGTSAMREAANGREFASQIREETGLDLRIISGEEEAELSYTGVKLGLTLEQPPLVCDLGGGSTEFIYYDDAFKLRLSIPLGAVRAHDMHWQTADFAERLNSVGEYQNRLAPYALVMVGGTATTLAAVDLEMIHYDWQKIQGHRLTRQRIQELYERLSFLSLKERRALPGLLPERADIIPYGAAIVLSILQVLQKEEMMVADTDLLTALLLIE